MLANIVVQFFLKGGLVMWPLLICAFIAVAVLGERAVWWLRESRKRDPKKLEQILAALENADVPAATKLAADSEDPVIRMIYRGLSHVNTSLQGALLGLLGTVTGLIQAFLSVGSAELSVVAVTGGIGSALIATASGLVIAIISLIPYNYFGGKIARLQFELETAATNVEVMVEAKRPAAGQ